ncbi:MAG TPA: diguanylate cyclase [Xanthomonadaceae bacterium]|nr:diguanylate cyclase [Xanthomonadaceae bacterium]
MRLGPKGMGAMVLLLASAAMAGMPPPAAQPAAGAPAAASLPVRLSLLDGEEIARLIGDGRGVLLSRPGEARVRLHVVLPDASPGDPPWVVRLERDSLALRIESGTWHGALRDFFAPRREVGLLPGSFSFNLPAGWSGPRTLDLVVATDAPRTLWPRVMSRDAAIRLENRAIALAGALYACLGVLIAIALSLFAAARDRAFLALAGFLLASLAVLLALNGHLYTLPWLRWFGAWRMAGIWTLILLAGASALLVMQRYASVAERAPRLRQLLQGLTGVLLGLAAVCLLNLDTGREWLQWGVTVGWELSAIGCMACTVVALRRGAWPGVPIALLSMQVMLVVTGTLYEMAMRGLGSDGFWIRHGYQLALIGCAVVLAIGLTGRITEYRTARERDRLARDDSERRLRREAARASLARALQQGLRERAPGEMEQAAFEAVLGHLVPLLRLRSAGVVARGWHGHDVLMAEPESRRPHVTALLADRLGMMKGLARTQAPLQLPLATAETPIPGRAEPVTTAPDMGAPAPLGRLHAVVPLPIASPGWGVLLLERDEARGFSHDELALASEFGRTAVVHVDEASAALHLRRSAELDSLTGALNRRAIDQCLAASFAQAWERQAPVAVLFVDMDHFKDINDTHGHASGDECLRALSETMRNSLRPGDTLGRYGGEEFLVLLPGRDVEGAVPIAERIRGAIEQQVLECNGQALRMTVSVGVATRRMHERDPDAAVERADRALYAAKRGGRNRVEVATDAGGEAE